MGVARAVIGYPVAGKVLRLNEACNGTKVARFQSLEVKVIASDANLSS